ncbi:SCO2583/SCO2584 N-terminal domain-containing protein [Kitasatospora aureofaciens]|uniref:SCO2583/SCO2584 N-terminal domain-containing protein n=1 Tax=Kitasatospora aureofaciens TaxID=1894 RepID=UPI0037CA3F89
MPIAEDPEPRPSQGREPGGSGPSGAGGKDPFADLVLDEEFVRSATVKEQSGRTRMLAARWKHTPPVDPGGRRSVNDGPAAPKRRFGRRPELRVVDPWGNPRPASRRGGWWRTPLVVLLVVAGLLASLNVNAISNWVSGLRSSKADAPVPVVAPETARPTAAPPDTPDDQPTVDHPWKASPAAGWPTGTEAMVLPEAKATGVFSADEVAAQLQQVKDYLAAANLDPKVIAGARPDAALAMLDHEDRKDAADALDHPGKDHDPLSWFSRFDPREAVLVGDAVKVQGRLSYEGDGDGGVLIHTDFTFVYPLQPGPDARKLAEDRPAPSATPSAPQGGTARPVGLVEPAAVTSGDTWTTRTIVRRVGDYRFYDPDRHQVDAKKIVLGKTMSDVGNNACSVYDGFVHPQFRQFARPHPEQTGPTTDPYDRSHDLAPSGQCGTTSRE